MPKTNLRPHQSALIAAILLAAVAYVFPPVHLLFLPMQYLNTHFHEMCHAIVATLTGGQVDHIRVNADGSGVTMIYGGNQFLVSSAGYIGATLIGASVIFFGRTPGRARVALGFLAFALAGSMLLWVRGDVVGVAAGFAWFFALGAGAAFLRGMPALFVCQLIGIEQCFNAIGSVYELLKISVFTEAHSDALNMQQVSYIPAPVWATGWCVFSLILVALTVRKAWNLDPPTGPAESPVPGR